MKTFAKIALLFITLCAINKAQAQCTPDPSVPRGTIQPESLKFGYINNAYSEVIYFRAPLDTTAKTPLGTFPARIDSMEITSVKGLPNGITYTCYNNNCMIKGGEAGCVLLSGTPDKDTVCPITVYIKSYVTIKGFVDIPATQNDSNSKYTLYVFTTVGLNKVNLEQLVSVYPNPAKDVLHISNTLSQPVQVQLLDITGKLIDEKQAGTTPVTFDTRSLSKGIYLVRLSSGSEVSVQKVIIE